MAMYTTVKGFINKVEVKEKMAVVSIAIASKRKDDKGEYTVKENNFFIRAVTFSKSLIEKLDGKEKLFCELSLKAESVKKEDNFFENWYLLGFTELTSSKAPEEATSTDTLSDEEKEEILSKHLTDNKK